MQWIIYWQYLCIFKPATYTGDNHSLEWRSCYNADVGWPSFEREQEVNRERVLMMTRGICETIHVP
jgi:hypothetical protein